MFKIAVTDGASVDSNPIRESKEPYALEYGTHVNAMCTCQTALHKVYKKVDSRLSSFWCPELRKCMPLRGSSDGSWKIKLVSQLCMDFKTCLCQSKLVLSFAFHHCSETSSCENILSCTALQPELSDLMIRNPKYGSQHGRGFLRPSG